MTVSGKALAAGIPTTPGDRSQHEPAASALPLTEADPANPITLFITFTTYGTWMPGDQRGWRKWKAGEQQPQPKLEAWCRGQMKEPPVVLTQTQRVAVEARIHRHAERRGWAIHAVSVRSNHVHMVVTVRPTLTLKERAAGKSPLKKVSDQFKANATGALLQLEAPINNEKVWTKGQDIEIIDTDADLEQVILYVSEAQDRMGRNQ